MSKYERTARLYPAILSSIVPAVIVLAIIWELQIPTVKQFLGWSYRLVTLSIGTALIASAIGFWGKELCRNTSKLLFQFPFFKEDETEMPTTKLLISEETSFGKYQLAKLFAKINNDFNDDLIDLKRQYSPNNSYEYRKEVVAVVALIRQKTKGDPILLNYNIRYGFGRNLLGGMTIGIVFTIILLLGTNFMNMGVTVRQLLFALILQIALFLITLLFFKQTAREYARQLFYSYQNL